MGVECRFVVAQAGQRLGAHLQETLFERAAVCRVQGASSGVGSFARAPGSQLTLGDLEPDGWGDERIGVGIGGHGLHGLKVLVGGIEGEAAHECVAAVRCPRVQELQRILAAAGLGQRQRPREAHLALSRLWQSRLREQLQLVDRRGEIALDEQEPRFGEGVTLVGRRRIEAITNGRCRRARHAPRTGHAPRSRYGVGRRSRGCRRRCRCRGRRNWCGVRRTGRRRGARHQESQNQKHCWPHPGHRRGP